MDRLVNQDPVIMDREWITLSFPDPRFIFGIRSFLKFAREHLPGREIILCPCTTCKCARLPISYDDLEIHLMRNGFDRTYRVWNVHGEHASPECTERTSSSQQYHSVPDLNKVQNVVVQEFGGNNLDEKLNKLYSSNHASRMTSVDDAPTQLVGPDSRGRMRGLGCSIRKTGLKKSAPACSKANTVTKEKESLAQEILEIKKTLADMKAWMSMQQEARSGQNPSTPPAAQSSQASSPDTIYIGKRCDLLGWGTRGVVARGQVHEVDPNAVVHSQPLEEGAFVVVLTEILKPDAPLWNEDGFACTLGEAGLGSFVQWGKDSLRV